jgi:hypothetical protein
MAAVKKPFKNIATLAAGLSFAFKKSNKSCLYEEIKVE